MRLFQHFSDLLKILERFATNRIRIWRAEFGQIATANRTCFRVVSVFCDDKGSFTLDSSTWTALDTNNAHFMSPLIDSYYPSLRVMQIPVGKLSFMVSVTHSLSSPPIAFVFDAFQPPNSVNMHLLSSMNYHQHLSSDHVHSRSVWEPVYEPSFTWFSSISFLFLMAEQA